MCHVLGLATALLSDADNATSRLKFHHDKRTLRSCRRYDDESRSSFATFFCKRPDIKQVNRSQKKAAR
ncbi:hypothetical protein RISK_000682 [Rhodopirellula islandica]|uniref:Uncharacterized protein n=1 Tax=Rhodopirellula islandica TaxID=595434 RepID=A0A0J1EQ35_RHOIS|nr:hypothetical protein RISK_000682 [Rhodopirellula islandica]